MVVPFWREKGWKGRMRLAWSARDKWGCVRDGWMCHRYECTCGRKEWVGGTSTCDERGVNVQERNGYVGVNKAAVGN